MRLPRLWTQLAAIGLMSFAAAIAGGQEASSDKSSTAVPTTNDTDASAAKNQPIESSTSASKADQPPSPRDAAATPPPAAPRDELGELIEQAIAVTGQRKLTAGVHTPWQVVHGILAMRWDLNLRLPNSREEVSGIEWITSGVSFDGQPLWEATAYGGRGHPFTRPYAFEGHPTQFMGYMSMADIPLDYEVKTPTKVITIRDIINDAKMQVRQGVEITWTLWALAHYEPSDSQWFNAYGEPWSIERLLKLQVDEPVTSGACGGCHGLFALAYARNMYIEPGKSIRGVWLEADQKIKQYIEFAKALQNPDGSFSSNHFKGPGYSDDFATRITTSGHQLEWLMVALPQHKLKEEWVRRALRNVATDLIKNKNVSADCGPLFHGMHALVVYRQRTVPGYLVPKFNSHVKFAERRHKNSAIDATRPAGQPGDVSGAPKTRHTSKPVPTAARPGWTPSGARLSPPVPLDAFR